MKLAVNLNAVMSGHPMPDSLQRIKDCGYNAFEIWSWWDAAFDALHKEKKRLHMEAISLCTKFISLTDPAQRDAYTAGLAESIAAAKTINAPLLVSQIGADTGAGFAAQRDSIVEGLRRSAPLLEEAGITLVVEPLNLRVDHAGYFLSASDDAFDIVNRVNSKNVKVLFDIYHQQITEGDILRRIRQNIDLIGHFHAAGNPGRHELYNNELDYGYIFAEIEKTGYDGYIALEYIPVDPYEKGLTHALQLAQAASCPHQ